MTGFGFLRKTLGDGGELYEGRGVYILEASATQFHAKPSGSDQVATVAKENVRVVTDEIDGEVGWASLEVPA